LTDTNNSTVTSCAKPETTPRPQLIILGNEAWDRSDLRSPARRIADEAAAEEREAVMARALAMAEQ
jgi:hypothetical protein